MHSKRIQDKVKEDYNQIAREFSSTRNHSWKEFELFIPFLKNVAVADLGCGNGRLLDFLTEHGIKDYTGVDQSAGLLKEAKAKHPKARFIEADISKPLKLEKKEALFAIASFHHIPPRDQLATLKLWRAYLKKDGHLFMTNWNLFQRRFLSSWLNPKRPSFFGLLIPWKNKVDRYYYAFTKGRLKRLLKKAGFEIVLFETGMNFTLIAK